MVRVMALIIKFCQRCRRGDTVSSEFMLTSGDLQVAETKILKMVQEQELYPEISFYQDQRSIATSKMRPNKKMRTKSKLWKLDPFIDENGVLRVGGRMKKSTLNNASKHPIILPK